MINLDCTRPQIIELPKILDKRGNLSFIEENEHIPFEIARSHWIYDVPGGTERGGHAYYENLEFIVAISGSFDVVVNTGLQELTYHLNRSYYGLLIPNKIWRVMNNFSTNSLALILSSLPYDPNDYIRNEEDFKRINSDERNKRI